MNHIEDQISVLERRFDDLLTQERDIQFYKKCIVNEFVKTVQSMFLADFPYTLKTYKDMNSKDSKVSKLIIDNVMNTIHEKLCNRAVYVKTVIRGYNGYGIEIYFDVDDRHYYLYVPMRDNISADVVWKNSYYGSEDAYVDWNIAKYAVVEEVYECVQTTRWQGYNLTDCTLFKQSDPEELPFE